MNGTSRTLIAEQKVAAHLRVADSYVTNIEWQPKAESPPAGQLHRSRILSQAVGVPSASLVESLKQVRKDGSSYLGEAEHRVLFAVRRGMQIALAVADEYRKLVGIEHIGDLNRLSNDKRAELQEKVRTAAAIVLFTTARFVAEYLTDASIEAAHEEHVTLPECVIEEPMSALRCMLFYLSANIAHPRVNNDKALVSTAVHFFEKVLEEVEARKASLTHLDQFQSILYGVEGSDFTIEGLERHETGAVSVEFNRVEMSSIVGNSDAKHFVLRLAQRLVCYNLNAKMNVFQELGGLMPVWMGYGKPGTGKSMIIAALATLLDDLCRARGIPFLYHPLPDNLIDSYQGNSAKNMVAWMKPLQSDDRILFGAIDDGENNLEERTRQGVSEGARAVTGVFLRYTEGAYAIKRGNSTIGILSNIPEEIDGAVRSRVQGRMIIDGAKTVEDALDQGELWWRKFADQKGFIDLKDPDWYEYQSAQARIASMAEAAETRDEPEHAIMREVFNRVLRDHDPGTQEFFARLFVAVEERYPLFSSRDKRNIDSATDLRIMDFDLPKEWFENSDVFHNQDYARQKDMVLELRNANMKGLKFSDIWRQEWVRYLDNYARIADAQFDREVDERVKQHRIDREVTRRLKESGDVNHA